MPDLTPNLALPDMSGTDGATRTSITTVFNKIDEQVQQSQFLTRQGLTEPGAAVINDVVFNAGPNTITINIGKGQIRWGTTLRVFAAHTESIATPLPSTTYYIFAKSDGTWVQRTALTMVNGEAPIISVQTANPVATATLVVTDLRGLLPNTDTADLTTRQILGTTDADTNLIFALDVAIDLRRPYYTYNSDGTIATKVIKNQANTVTYATYTFTYASGRLSTIVMTVGALTITWTYAYNSDGSIANIAKTVV